MAMSTNAQGITSITPQQPPAKFYTNTSNEGRAVWVYNPYDGTYSGTLENNPNTGWQKGFTWDAVKGGVTRYDPSNGIWAQAQDRMGWGGSEIQNGVSKSGKYDFGTIDANGNLTGALANFNPGAIMPKGTSGINSWTLGDVLKTVGGAAGGLALTNNLLPNALGGTLGGIGVVNPKQSGNATPQNAQNTGGYTPDPTLAGGTPVGTYPDPTTDSWIPSPSTTPDGIPSGVQGADWLNTYINPGGNLVNPPAGTPQNMIDYLNGVTSGGGAAGVGGTGIPGGIPGVGGTGTGTNPSLYDQIMKYLPQVAGVAGMFSTPAGQGGYDATNQAQEALLRKMLENANANDPAYAQLLDWVQGKNLPDWAKAPTIPTLATPPSFQSPDPNADQKAVQDAYGTLGNESVNNLYDRSVADLNKNFGMRGFLGSANSGQASGLLQLGLQRDTNLANMNAQGTLAGLTARNTALDRLNANNQNIFNNTNTNTTTGFNMGQQSNQTQAGNFNSWMQMLNGRSNPLQSIASGYGNLSNTYGNQVAGSNQNLAQLMQAWGTSNKLKNTNNPYLLT